MTDEVVAKPKKLVKSKTLWLNTVVTVLGIIAALDPALFAGFGPQVVAAAITLIGAANLVLRLVTKTSVKVGGE